MERKNGEMAVGDTVYFWHNDMLDEGEIVIFGGANQVIVQYGDEWLLFDVSDVKLAKDVDEKEWKHYNH